MDKKQDLTAFLCDALEGFKAQDITVFDVRGKHSATDTMIIATGTSSRHISAMADNLIRDCKQAGFEVFAEEGKAVADWVVVDLGQAFVHLMQQEARELYQLEKLWC